MPRPAPPFSVPQKKAKQKASSRPHTLFATGPQQAPGPGLELEGPPPAAMGPTGFAAGMPMPPPPAMPPMMGVPGADRWCDAQRPAWAVPAFIWVVEVCLYRPPAVSGGGAQLGCDLSAACFVIC